MDIEYRILELLATPWPAEITAQASSDGRRPRIGKPVIF
jgi:hypothetical protein